MTTAMVNVLTPTAAGSRPAPRSAGCGRSPARTWSCSTRPRPRRHGSWRGISPGTWPAPTGATATGQPRSRWRSPSRGACRGPTRRAAGGQRVRGGHHRADRRCGARRVAGSHAVAAVRAGRPAVRGGPQPCGRRHASGGRLAHVPAGWHGDATQTIIAQIERYVPGFTSRIRQTQVRAVGDIGGERQLRRGRHRHRREHPPATGVPPAGGSRPVRDGGPQRLCVRQRPRQVLARTACVAGMRRARRCGRSTARRREASSRATSAAVGCAAASRVARGQGVRGGDAGHAGSHGATRLVVTAACAAPTAGGQRSR